MRFTAKRWNPSLEIVPASVDEAEWPDVIAAAASQARGRAEQDVVSGIGPGRSSSSQPMLSG
jgi:hypothetical protein